MNDNEYGRIRIRAYTASDALPIEDAKVYLYGSDDIGKDTKYILYTDNDGITETVLLPAPKTSYSQSPHPKEQPYSTYNVEVSKNGYYDKILYNVVVFSGIDAELPVNMIPYNDGQDYPHGNVNGYITENELLEQ